MTRTVRVRTSAERESERERERAAVSKICATVRTEQDEGGEANTRPTLLHTFQCIPDHKIHHCILYRRSEQHSSEEEHSVQLSSRG